MPSKIKFADSHTHLYDKQFDNERDNVIDDALIAGVDKLFMPNVDSASIGGMIALADKHPNHCFPMMGLHPCSVKANVMDELAVIEKHLHDKGVKRFVAIGEIGLDYFWDRTFDAEQIAAFEIQIGWAKQVNLPIVIHSRDSMHDTIRIVSKQNTPQLKGIFHCFTGTIEEARQITDLGFYIGIGGVVTFKNSHLPEVVKAIDLKYIVLETDAPYLAPTPYRGKRNESAYLPLIAQKIADIKQVSIQQVAEITTHNTLSIFGVNQ